jgi:hypothetical protein
MDHIYVEENQIADRYVMGTLPAEEAERFENHYLSCPECLDRLELAESVQRGFKRMAGQDVAKLAAAHQLAVVAWLARLGRLRQLGVLLAVLLVPAAIPAGVAVTQLAQARSTLKEERQRSAAAGPLREELARERQVRAHVETQLAQALKSHVNYVIVSLVVERGLGLEGPPTQQVHLPKDGGWIVLEVPVDPPFQPSYRAVLRDSQDHEVRRIVGLQRIGNDTLNFSLPSSLLPSGDYTLAIEGLMPGGKTTAAGRFTFRVLPPER